MGQSITRVGTSLRQFETAKHVLAESEAFDDADLVEIVDHVSTEHRLLILSRKAVPPVVADRIAKISESNVLQQLVQNNDAELSEHAIDVLVGQSRKQESLCPLLIKRLEMKPAQAMAMFWWADGPTRCTILQRHAADRLEMIEMCADVRLLKDE
jgi:uncharacterized protein (DUF2336 family)